jgi:S-(hydroxymethyl)glutathione dehydrogenase/alcohol dehydrogenase
MKAAILQTPGHLDIVDLVIDKPAPHEVLLRTVGSGLCHSDLHAIDAAAGQRPVMVPGHEVSAIVEQVGSEVGYVQPGDHVITFLVQFCGACEYCLGGHPTICSAPVGARPANTNPRLTYNGAPVSQFANLGGFAEQMLVHEHAVAKIDRDYPLDRAAIIGCGVCTGLGSVLKSASVKPGSTVAVVGGGGVGLSAVQGARIAGARRIFLVDIQPEKPTGIRSSRSGT